MALTGLFSGQAPEAEEARGILRQGLTDDPALHRRGIGTDDLALIAEVSTSAQPPRWDPTRDEGALVQSNGDRFRVVSRLGEGAAGRTFKLEQLDDKTDEPIGTYVGKVVLNPEFGETALTAYRKIRAIADHPALSGVYQTAGSWQSNQLVALLKWRPGEPLDNIRGEYLALLADDLQEEGTFDREALILGWD